MKNFIFIFLLIFYQSLVDANTIAILGDSVSAASVFNKDLVLNFEKRFFEDLHTKYDQQNRIIWPSYKEYTGAAQWVFLNLQHLFYNVFFVDQKLSLAYIFAKNKNIDMNNILNLAFVNARYDSLPRQALRLLENTNNVLPSTIIIFLSGLDVCAPSLEMIPSKDQYEQSLQSSLELLVKNVNTDQKIRIILIDPINYHQIAYDQNILQKKVQIFNNENKTCETIQKENYLVKYLAKKMHYYFIIPQDILGFCPTMFNKNANLSYIANRLREFREVNSKILNFLKSKYFKLYPNLHFLHIQNTQFFKLQANDVSDNCLLLSKEGYKNLANFIYLELSQKS